LLRLGGAIGAGDIDLAGARAPQFLTAGARGHNRIYRAPATVRSVRNFWDPNIHQHGMTLGQPNFARWPRVAGRPKFLQNPACSPTRGGA